MHVWLHKFEKTVDFLIGPLLIILLVVLAAELVLDEHFERYSVYVDYFDFFLILVFTIDLGFKYNRVRKIPKFLKMYWIQIIAVIPFFMMFRVTELFGLQEIFEKSQSIFHGIPELQKLQKDAIAMIAEAGRASRTAKFVRMLKFASRFPRFLRATTFFETPTGDHHWHEKKKR